MTPTHLSELLTSGLHITGATGYRVGTTIRDVEALPLTDDPAIGFPIAFTPPLRGPSFQTASNRSSILLNHQGQWRGIMIESLDLTGRGPDGESLNWWIRFFPPGIPAGDCAVVLPPGTLQLHAALNGLLFPAPSPIPQGSDRHSVPGWSSRYFIYGMLDPTEGLGEEAVLYLDRSGRVAGVEATMNDGDPPTVRHQWWELIGPCPDCPGTEMAAGGKQQHAHPA
jgi:hypothetical protein